MLVIEPAEWRHYPIHVDDADEKAAAGDRVVWYVIKSQLSVYLDTEVANNGRRLDGDCADCQAEIWTKEL